MNCLKKKSAASNVTELYEADRNKHFSPPDLYGLLFSVGILKNISVIDDDVIEAGL